MLRIINSESTEYLLSTDDISSFNTPVGGTIRIWKDELRPSEFEVLSVQDRYRCDGPYITHTIEVRVKPTNS